MANPKLENGFLRIEMELVDQFYKHRFSGQEWQIIWFTWRKTIGWSKEMDKISLSQYSKATGIDRRKCFSLLSGMIDRKIMKKDVTFIDDRKHISYGFNKNYSQWILSPKKVTVTQKGDTLSPKKSPTIDTITIDKNPPIIPPSENTYPPWLNKELWADFVIFRKEMPRPKGVPLTPRAEKSAIRKLKSLMDAGYKQSDIINQSIENGWKGLFPVMNKQGPSDKKSGECIVCGDFFEKLDHGLCDECKWRAR